MHCNNDTAYRGVMYRKDKRQYVARITVNGECHNLGYRDTEEEAKAAFDAAERRLCGGLQTRPTGR